MNEEKPTHLDLFSGIGGFALAAREAGFRTVAFCEIDPYCQSVLSKNFLADTERAGVPHNGCAEASGTPEALQANPSERERLRTDVRQCDHPRIFGNIFDFDGAAYRGVSLLTGGFPCQPFSVAGKRRGKEDDRHLWPEMLRVIKEARPAWVLGENVPGIIPMELDNVLSDMESLGYACRPFVIPACAVDARHRRDRLWIVAHSNESRPQGRNGAELRKCAGERVTRTGDSWCQSKGEIISDSASHRRQAKRKRPETGHVNGLHQLRRQQPAYWLAEPDVGRVAHGIPARVDRLRGLGNAIVPQVAFEILKAIRPLISHD